VHHPDKILALESNKYTDIYHNQTGATFTFVDDFYERIAGTQPTKLITIVEPDMRETVYQQFVERWGTEANVTRTNPEYVELNAKGVDKGIALIELCRILDAPIHQTIAFGDNYSDLPMIEVAGGKVLMDNASDEIKAELKEKFNDLVIAPSNEEDGVARIIETL
jgi:hydroxymethylpyrimidine pyrophosphatase-like HAD family hydrolase